MHDLLITDDATYPPTLFYGLHGVSLLGFNLAQEYTWEVSMAFPASLIPENLDAEVTS